MLDFEAALARAEARVGVIPADAAAAIAEAAVAEGFDMAELVRSIVARGDAGDSPGPHADRDACAPAAKRAAGFVHWGATSQDVTDTALVLLLGRCRAVLEADHERVSRALRRLSDEHAER